MRCLFASALAATLFVAAAGCYVGPSARPVDFGARAEHRAAISLQEVDGNIFKFTVENLTSETMVVNRDRIFLGTPAGTVARSAGGASHTYTLPPGGAHDVNVRFDLAGLASGTRVEVLFDDALEIRGTKVDVKPIAFVVD